MRTSLVSPPIVQMTDDVEQKRKSLLERPQTQLSSTARNSLNKGAYTLVSQKREALSHLDAAENTLKEAFELIDLQRQLIENLYDELDLAIEKSRADTQETVAVHTQEEPGSIKVSMSRYHTEDRCPFCLLEFRSKCLWICDKCGKPYHEECGRDIWQKNNSRCSCCRQSAGYHLITPTVSDYIQVQFGDSVSSVSWKSEVLISLTSSVSAQKRDEIETYVKQFDANAQIR